MSNNNEGSGNQVNTTHSCENEVSKTQEIGRAAGMSTRNNEERLTIFRRSHRKMRNDQT